MHRRIDIPVWLIVLFAGWQVLLTAGVAIALITAGVFPSLPVAVASGGPATATLMPTPPPTALQPAVIHPTIEPCSEGENPGVDCPILVSGIAVTVKSLERRPTFTDGSGQEWEPEDSSREFLVVHLELPAGTVKADLDPWFEDGGTHAPRVIDETGKVSGFNFAFVEEGLLEFGLVITFMVSKEAKALTLVLQGDARVELSKVRGMTVAATPVPLPTSLFGP